MKNTEYLSKYDTGSLAKRLGNTPEADGDGQTYRGRGLIYITGRTNYIACGEALAFDLVNHPDLLEKNQHVCISAAWFWRAGGLVQANSTPSPGAAAPCCKAGSRDSRALPWSLCARRRPAEQLAVRCSTPHARTITGTSMARSRPCSTPTKGWSKRFNRSRRSC